MSVPRSDSPWSSDVCFSPSQALQSCECSGQHISLTDCMIDSYAGKESGLNVLLYAIFERSRRTGSEVREEVERSL